MKNLFLTVLGLVTLVAMPAFAADATSSAIHAPHAWGWFFQSDDSELSDRMLRFHNYVFVIIAVITVLVIGLMGYIIVKFRARPDRKPSKTTHNTLLEVIWTAIPIAIVVAIIIPSVKLLYYVDKVEDADMTLKVVGYQWYWGYELPDQHVAEFESRLIPEADLKQGQKRLFEVDQPIVLPVGKTIRVLLTGDPAGVIHAWGIPSLKFKRDAIPGRVNEGWLKINSEGTYYGDCYELCGPDHAFMPVVIKAVSEQEFNDWVIAKGGKIQGSQVEVIDASPAVQVVPPVGAPATAPAVKENSKQQGNI